MINLKSLLLEKEKLGKGQIIKFFKNMANMHVSTGDEIEILSNIHPDGMGSPSLKIKNLRNNKIYTIEPGLLQTAFNKKYAKIVSIKGKG